MRKIKQVVVVLLVLHILTIQIPMISISFSTLEYEIDERYVLPTKQQKESFEEKLYKYKESILPYTKAWDIAKSLVGKRGDCFYIVKLFTKSYSGIDLKREDLYRISYEELQPGDIMYYRNGGLGVEHWAVWLGNDYALQGNYNGRARITTAWLEHATNPIFYRVEMY